MATSVNLSKELLDALDRESAKRGMSRSRFIVHVLSRVVEHQGEHWNGDTFEQLRLSILAEERGGRR